MSHEKVRPGQKIAKSTFGRAAFANDAIDLVNAHKEGRLAGGRRAAVGSRSRATVQIRNSTGADLVRGEVVQLVGHLLDNISPDHPWFDADVIASPAEYRMAIVTRPILDGEIGPAQMIGVCLAQVNVSDAGHTHAVPVVGDTELASAESGPVELLMDPDGTGVQELWVLIDRTPVGVEIKYGECAADHDKDDIGDINIIDEDSDVPTSEVVEDVRNVYADLPEGARCHIVRINTTWMLIAGECNI